MLNKNLCCTGEQNMDKWEVYDEVRKLQMELVKVDSDGWYRNEFLTFSWWVLLALSIIPFIVYTALHKRENIVATMLVGMFVALITLTFDVIGSDLDFWGYPTELISPGPGALTFDLALVPIAFMLIYQYFSSWKKYLVALVLMALFYTFIGEQLSVLFDLYRKINWNAFYSLIYYLIVGVFVKWFVDKLVKIEKKSNSV
jgi:hypothetical protein